jgi:hypothetical protein
MLQKLVQEQQVEIARNTECRCAPQLNLHTHTHTTQQLVMQQLFLHTHPNNQHYSLKKPQIF